jgi:hypothetical protein
MKITRKEGDGGKDTAYTRKKGDGGAPRKQDKRVRDRRGESIKQATLSDLLCMLARDADKFRDLGVKIRAKCPGGPRLVERVSANGAQRVQCETSGGTTAPTSTPR